VDDLNFLFVDNLDQTTVWLLRQSTGWIVKLEFVLRG
jgi:hypothetical protein